MYSLVKDLKDQTAPFRPLYIKNFLTKEEINFIFKFVEREKFERATTYIDLNDTNPNFLHYENILQEKNTKPRQSKIFWIRYDKTNSELACLFKKISNEIIKVNEEYFKFKLTDLEPFQFTSYEIGEYYKKHTDTGLELDIGNTHRKISFSIQLSDENQYDGGELLYHNSYDPIVAEKNLGSISFFPSFMLHEVTPVTRGVRYSLVGWVNGPRFE